MVVYLWPEVWLRISTQPGAPAELLGEIYRSMSAAQSVPVAPGTLAEALQNPAVAGSALAALRPSHFADEQKVLKALADSHDVFEEYDLTSLQVRYAAMLHSFSKRHGLRYQIVRPFSISPTLEGIFESLIFELRSISKSDPNVKELLLECEQAFRDVAHPFEASRIKVSLQKHFNLAEGFLGVQPGVTTQSLGQMANQINAWPHDKVREALRALYIFASDYPGIRHRGTAANRLRDLEARDMVAVPILLAGLAAYAADGLDHKAIIGGR